jgi:hypothetical protein
MRGANLVGGSGQGVGVVSLGQPMAADQYRQRAFEAQQCATQATEPSVKHVCNNGSPLPNRWIDLSGATARSSLRVTDLRRSSQ